MRLLLWLLEAPSAAKALMASGSVPVLAPGFPVPCLGSETQGQVQGGLGTGLRCGSSAARCSAAELGTEEQTLVSPHGQEQAEVAQGPPEDPPPELMVRAAASGKSLLEEMEESFRVGGKEAVLACVANDRDMHSQMSYKAKR